MKYTICLPICLLLLLMFLFVEQGHSQEWVHFPRNQKIQDAMAMPNGLWLATSGGVTFLDATNASVKAYTPANGLHSANIQKMIADSSQNMYCFDYNNMIYKLDASGKNWDLEHSSFAEAPSRMLTSATRYHSDHMIVVFHDKLSFYNIEQKRSLLTLTKIGPYNLKADTIQDMELMQDTLYIAVGDTQVYKRYIDFANIQNDYSLSDPGTWQLHANTSFYINDLFVSQNTLQSSPLQGIRYTNGKEYSSYLGDNQYASIGTDTLRFGFLYATLRNEQEDSTGFYNNNFYLGQSSTRDWIISPYAVYSYTGGTTPQLVNHTSGWMSGPISNITAIHGNYAVAWSNHTIGLIQDDSIEYRDVYPLFFPHDATRSYTDYFKSLATDNAGNIFVGGFGAGLLGIFNTDTTLNQDEMQVFGGPLNTDRSCPKEYFADGFSLSLGTSPDPDGAGAWFNSSGLAGETFGIGYVGANQTTHCPTINVDERLAWAIHAFKSTSHTELLVSASNTLDGASLAALYHFRVNPTTPPSVTLIRKLRTDSLGLVQDLFVDQNHRAWLMSQTAIGYYDLDSNQTNWSDSVYTLGPEIIKSTAPFTAIEKAIDGIFVYSTVGDGVYVMDVRAQKQRDWEQKHILSKNGLLSNIVYDVAVDPEDAYIWFAHDAGISKWKTSFRTQSQFDLDNAPGIIAYPIPFRPGVHEHFVVDNLPTKSVVRIFDQSGQVVQYFAGQSLTGGILQWDGKDKNGTYVKSGLYFYSVTGGVRSKKGAFPVLR